MEERTCLRLLFRVDSHHASMALWNRVQKMLPGRRFRNINLRQAIWWNNIKLVRMTRALAPVPFEVLEDDLWWLIERGGDARILDEVVPFGGAVKRLLIISMGCKHVDAWVTLIGKLDISKAYYVEWQANSTSQPRMRAANGVVTCCLPATPRNMPC